MIMISLFCSDNNKCVYIFMREGKEERKRERERVKHICLRRRCCWCSIYRSPSTFIVLKQFYYGMWDNCIIWCILSYNMHEHSCSVGKWREKERKAKQQQLMRRWQSMNCNKVTRTKFWQLIVVVVVVSSIGGFQAGSILDSTRF